MREICRNIMYWCFLTKSTAILQSRARTIVRLLRYLKRVKITVLHVFAHLKAFNIAGIQTAAVIVPDKTIRHRVSRGI